MNSCFSAQCQNLFNTLGGDAYGIPRRTAFFLNPAPRKEDILYHLTGFTGSSAYGLMTRDCFFLYVDSRYTLQAQQECPECTIITCDHPLQELPNQCPAGTRLIVSPWTHSHDESSQYAQAASAHGWILIDDWHQALDGVIKTEPIQSKSPIYAIPNTVSFQEKCRSVLTNHHQKYWLMCSAADVAWLTNLRSSDHDYTPFFDAYLLIKRNESDGQRSSPQEALFSGTLYTSMPRSIEGLDPAIQVVDFESLNLLSHAQSTRLSHDHPLDQAIRYDPKKTPKGLVRPHWIADSVEQMAQHRSIKNPWELSHITQAHILDGVALTQFLHWLSAIDDPRLESGLETEWSACEMLKTFRQQHASYKGHSFPTISAMGTNSAMMHYTPSCLQSDPLAYGLYLIDSGGQYFYGTTDVTRTVWLGSDHPSKSWQQKYTAVLQGHIHLSSMIFPYGTTGCQLDAVARSFLWQKGWDYAHSTGHGVSCFGLVHEMPPSISARENRSAITAHMIFSVEPGYYQAGLGGIRLENVVCVMEKERRKPVIHTQDALLSGVQQDAREETQQFYLKPFTMAPFDRRLIDVDALSYEHKLWLNQYHKQVYDTLAPQLPQETRTWLYGQTLPL
ncbi:MAG: M24 family metallopeptidase [Alphaproteobacteria bacterium]|nr:M24 family metallopeptidase [Alphaproteobacteria bacterium]